MELFPAVGSRAPESGKRKDPHALRVKAVLAAIVLTSARKPKISADMSAHGEHDDDAHASDGDHDEHDDHHAAPPAPEEPATPLWLTLLGIGLFLAAGIVFLATRADGKTTAELTAVPSAEAAASAAPVPAPAPQPGAAVPAPGAVRMGAPPNPPGTPPSGQ